jgi:hypothetical protein
VSTIAKIKIASAFPLAFLLGVIVTALLQLFQVGGGAMTLILGGGLLLLLVFDHYANRAGNFAIFRAIAKYDGDPETTRARIDASEADDSGTPPLARLLQVAGFAIGVLVCIIWSPSEVLDWIERRPFF